VKVDVSTDLFVFSVFGSSACYECLRCNFFFINKSSFFQQILHNARVSLLIDISVLQELEKLSMIGLRFSQPKSGCAQYLLKKIAILNGEDQGS
jgi:hypothetical protein